MDNEFYPSVTYTHATRRLANDDLTLVTVVCHFHRFILPELLTHRAFSRNSGSSRATGIKPRIEQVIDDPAMPLRYGKNLAGKMYDEAELPDSDKEEVDWSIRRLRLRTAADVKEMAGVGLHKQVANRYLEPWMIQTMVVTAQYFQWQDFFNLRLNPDVQPEMIALASQLEGAVDEAVSKTPYIQSNPFQCEHLPFVEDIDPLGLAVDKSRWAPLPYEITDMELISAGRAASVSYRSDPLEMGWLKALNLGRRLANLRHMSPWEHQASFAKGWHANKLHWRDKRFEISPPPYSNWKRGK